MPDDTRWIDADELPALLAPGQRVFVAGGVGEPRALTAALAAAPEASRGVHYTATNLPGMTGFVPPGTSELDTFFMTPELREAAAEGRVHFLPMQYRDMYDHLAARTWDLVFTQVAPPRDSPSGPRCSLGLAVDFLPAALERAVTVVAEVNDRLPSPPGAPTIPLARVDYAVATSRDFPVEEGAPTETARAVGENVASLVHDGDCVQTGIGAVPGAVLASLTDKNDLGFHSGMLTEGVLELIDRGVLTGSQKTRDRGLHVTGFVLGSERLYVWAAECEALRFQPASYTHDVRVLAEIDNFVAINSAIEVDLLGQVNAEMLQGRQISGTGGSVDFFRGAARSRGGRSIVALPATDRRGEHSRIVPALGSGTVATALRTDVDIIVTEHGIAEIGGKSVAARARALIDVAAPQFRPVLESAWQKGQ